MRNYDGKEYRYRSSDFLKKKGLAALSSHLKFEPIKKGLVYDITLYAGGTGIYDKLAASFPGNSEILDLIKEKHEVLMPLEASHHEEWSDDFNWLIEREESAESPVECSINFIASKMLPFQQVLDNNCFIYFVEWSDVNDWTLFWVKDDQINFISFSQG
ncbi:hypothetical protein [Enterovibrio norvegicus]|uniref:hypothetical protein n=1 Tax=Enterovibrio norvegicus TaxID=188144 RepID=UPI000C82584D|nr:hypothetical protein [Enterovibrio norvegicus]PML75750.1 hypothetical protein BCT69_24220 [Enterovibrio norvegicus]